MKDGMVSPPLLLEFSKPDGKIFGLGGNNASVHLVGKKSLHDFPEDLFAAMYTKANLASLRVKKDIAELSRQRFSAAHSSTSIEFPDGQRNLLKLKVGVSMTAGLYEGATFYFILTIPPSYPFHAPSVTCTTRAWHPNINLDTGAVSLPILTKDWRPVLSINTVVFALQLMFLEPTDQMPVNEAAAAALSNPEVFREQVRRTLAGGWLFGVDFEPHTKEVGWARGGTVKRKRGEGMDTDAVQSTLQAMRIQGDESAEVIPWDKRARRQDELLQYGVAEQGQEQQAKQQHEQQQHDSQGENPVDKRQAWMDRGFVPQDVPRVGPGPLQCPQQGHFVAGTGPGAMPTCSSNSSMCGNTAFDRVTLQNLGQAEVTTTGISTGFGCNAGVLSGHISQRPSTVVPDTAGAGVGWGDQMQALSSPRIG